MKSTTNRYRPPRVQYALDTWSKQKNNAAKTSAPKNKKRKLET